MGVDPWEKYVQVGVGVGLAVVIEDRMGGSWAKVAPKLILIDYFLS